MARHELKGQGKAEPTPYRDSQFFAQVFKERSRESTPPNAEAKVKPSNMLWVEWAAKQKAEAEAGAAATPAAPISTAPAASTGFSSGLYSGPPKASAATVATAAPVADAPPVVPTPPAAINTRTAAASTGAGMKEEVGAYIAKVKADVDAVAKARAEKEEPTGLEAKAKVEVEVEVGLRKCRRSRHGDGKDELREILLSSIHTPRSS